MNCKICSSKKIDIIGEIYDYEYNLDEKARYLKCLKCKTIFRNKISFNKRKLYPKNYIPTGSNFFFNFLKNMYSIYEYKKIINKLDIDKSRILEIGCGNGYLLKRIAENSNTKCLGIDFGIKSNNKKNIRFLRQKIENIENIKKFKPDIIILNNIIEHLKDFSLIKNLFKKLKKRAKIVIITPDGESSARNIFNLFWSGYHSPRHSFIFSKNSFYKISKICNLEIKSFVKIFDPFSNFISIKNILIGCFKMKNQKINISLLFSCFKIFEDFINNNRLFFIMEKK